MKAWMRYFIGDSWLLSDVCDSHSHLRLQVKIKSCKKKNIKAFYLPFIMWRLAILQTSQLELITAIALLLLLHDQPFSRLLDAAFYLFEFAKRLLPHYYSLKLENLVCCLGIIGNMFYRGPLEVDVIISAKNKTNGSATKQGNTEDKIHNFCPILNLFSTLNFFNKLLVLQLFGQYL